MSVRAKFRVAKIERWKMSGTEVQTVVLQAVMNDGTPENERFWKLTPSGEIRLNTVNANAAAQFELESEHYVDFTKVE